MKIAVSACLLGRNCKYNGGNNRSQAVLDFLKGHVVIPVCPEVTGGLPVPRVPVELKGGRAINKNGEDVTAYFRRGVEQTMARLSAEEIDTMLSALSELCADGSSLVFDYPDENFFDALERRVQNTIMMAKAGGEPMQSAFSESSQDPYQPLQLRTVTAEWKPFSRPLPTGSKAS